MQITSMSHADCLTYITALQLCIIMRTRDPLCASLSSFILCKWQGEVQTTLRRCSWQAARTHPGFIYSPLLCHF